MSSIIHDFLRILTVRYKPRKSSPPGRHGDTENNLKIILTGYTGIAVNGGVTFWVKTKNQIFSVFSSVSPCLRGSIAVFRIKKAGLMLTVNAMRRKRERQQ
jgi:hypothetical protein